MIYTCVCVYEEKWGTWSATCAEISELYASVCVCVCDCENGYVKGEVCFVALILYVLDHWKKKDCMHLSACEKGDMFCGADWTNSSILA